MRAGYVVLTTPGHQHRAAHEQETHYIMENYVWVYIDCIVNHLCSGCLFAMCMGFPVGSEWCWEIHVLIYSGIAPPNCNNFTFLSTHRTPILSIIPIESQNLGFSWKICSNAQHHCPACCHCLFWTNWNSNSCRWY